MQRDRPRFGAGATEAGPFHPSVLLTPPSHPANGNIAMSRMYTQVVGL